MRMIKKEQCNDLNLISATTVVVIVIIIIIIRNVICDIACAVRRPDIRAIGFS